MAKKQNKSGKPKQDYRPSVPDDPSEIPSWLKDLRKRLGNRQNRRKVTQAEAAKRICVSVRAWSAWELGEDVPSPPFRLLLSLLAEEKI